MRASTWPRGWWRWASSTRRGARSTGCSRCATTARRGRCSWRWPCCAATRRSRRQQREWAKGHDDPTDTLPMQLGAALYRGQFREAERLVGELQRVYSAAGLPTASAGSACRHRHQPGVGRRRRPRAGADGAAARRRLRRSDRRRAADHGRARAAIARRRHASCRSPSRTRAPTAKRTAVLLRAMAPSATATSPAPWPRWATCSTTPATTTGCWCTACWRGARGSGTSRSAISTWYRERPPPALGESWRGDGRARPGLRGRRPSRRRAQGLRRLPGVLEDRRRRFADRRGGQASASRAWRLEARAASGSG